MTASFCRSRLADPLFDQRETMALLESLGAAEVELIES